MLAFLSISLGLWENLRQLWLQNNGMEVTQISNVLSLGTFICVIAIIIFAKKVKPTRHKAFISVAIILKIANLLLLFGYNGSESLEIIKVLIIIGIILERLIIISIYPLIVTIKKEDTIYSKRKLTEYLFKDVGILIGGIFIGRAIGGIIVDYNICLLISIMFLLFAFVAAIRNKTG